MKMKIFAAAAVIAVILLVVWVIFAFHETDEKRIRWSLDELCRIGSKSPRETPALSALKANRSDKIFAPRCRFNFRVNSFDGEYTPTEIGARILRIQALFQWIKLSTSDVQVSVEGNKGSLIFTGELSGVTKHGGAEKINEIRDIEALLTKDDQGNWKFTAMKIRNILEK